MSVPFDDCDKNCKQNGIRKRKQSIQRYLILHAESVWPICHNAIGLNENVYEFDKEEYLGSGVLIYKKTR